jgi:protein-tyrosine phosphatase
MTRSGGTRSGIPLAVDEWRDLGGLRTSDGRTIRRGTLVRARSLDGLDADGWRALHALGVRTLIDLRNAEERGAAPAPAGMTALHLPLDGGDHEFWAEWGTDWRFGTPVYYAPHIARFPERSVAVLEAIANARPGGVLFHCMGGRDRTGMIAMLVLAAVGVAPEDIADDYELSAAAHPDGAAVAAGLARAGTTARAELLRTLEGLDLSFVGADVRGALCARLLERTAAG